MSSFHFTTPLTTSLSPFDAVVLSLVSLHILFSLASAAYVLHFHLRSSSSSPSLRRRIRLLLRLNSLWPVRLLLLIFASLLSLSELLRLPVFHSPSSLCVAYSLSSQSFAQPAFFATLLFLLRASTQPNPSPSSSLLSALAISLSSTLPFLAIHALYIFLSPWALRRLSLPPDFLQPTTITERCAHPIFGTALLALLSAVYVPLFISACWGAVTVVINKKLRVRLYTLAAAVVVSLSFQVSALALSALWNPSSDVAQGLGVVALVALLSCAAVGQEILVIMPVADALAIVTPERSASACGVAKGKEGGALEV